MTPFNRNFGQGGTRKAISPDMNWRELTKAGNIYEPGNSASYETGDWRTIRPVWNKDRCIHCLICWRYCPDASIISTDGKFDSFDYKHCKGCGICAKVCPVHAIDMFSEDEIDRQEEASKNEK
ncbi:MAG: pyruvate ferredoxin oxidoreductase delta subunit [Tepidanaerobacteraceae bacterium]|nr:pyruvate ferredoxin oxidoreductase delta subunit [Tepidanaerobacteraceae bacterium]